jgi:hypothetical protein
MTKKKLLSDIMYLLTTYRICRSSHPVWAIIEPFSSLPAVLTSIKLSFVTFSFLTFFGRLFAFPDKTLLLVLKGTVQDVFMAHKDLTEIIWFNCV